MRRIHITHSTSNGHLNAAVAVAQSEVAILFYHKSLGIRTHTLTQNHKFLQQKEKERQNEHGRVSEQESILRFDHDTLEECHALCCITVPFYVVVQPK